MLKKVRCQSSYTSSERTKFITYDFFPYETRFLSILLLFICLFWSSLCKLSKDWHQRWRSLHVNPSPLSLSANTSWVLILFSSCFCVGFIQFNHIPKAGRILQNIRLLSTFLLIRRVHDECCSSFRRVRAGWFIWPPSSCFLILCCQRPRKIWWISVSRLMMWLRSEQGSDIHSASWSHLGRALLGQDFSNIILHLHTSYSSHEAYRSLLCRNQHLILWISGLKQRWRYRQHHNGNQWAPFYPVEQCEGTKSFEQVVCWTSSNPHSLMTEVVHFLRLHPHCCVLKLQQSLTSKTLLVHLCGVSSVAALLSSPDCSGWSGPIWTEVKVFSSFLWNQNSINKVVPVSVGLMALLNTGTVAE